MYEHTPAHTEVKIVFLEITLGVRATHLKSKVETQKRKRKSTNSENDNKG